MWKSVWKTLKHFDLWKTKNNISDNLSQTYININICITFAIFRYVGKEKIVRNDFHIIHKVGRKSLFSYFRFV